MMDESHLGVEVNRNKPCQPMYVIFAAVVASVGGVLFGYDIGIISGALLQLKEVFHLTHFEQEMVVCAVLIGAFIASFFGGSIVDNWGRKLGIGLSCILFIIGALILSFSINFYMLIAGRLIVGVAISLSITSECTYISEISPPSRRGMMVSLNEVGITAGFLFAYLINYLFIKINNGWKFMFGAATILAVIQGLGVSFMPNSHHYLLIKGHTDEARKVLISLRNRDDVEEEMEAIISSIQEKKNHRYADLFSTSGNMRSRMFLGMALVFLQQFSGNANVLYYAPTVFQHFGYNSDTSATLVTVGLGVVKVISTIVTLLIVDKVGRRTLLLSGCVLMATSIMILGVVGTVSNVNPTIEKHKMYAIHQQPNILKDNSTENNEGIPWIISRNESEMKELLSFGSNTPINEIKNETGRLNLREHETQRYDLLTDSFNKERKSYGNFSLSIENNERAYLNKEEHEGKDETALPMNNNSIYTNSDRTKSTTSSDNMIEEDKPEVSIVTKVTSVISLMVFVCAYGMSYGPVSWLVLGEIFPGSLRGRAFSIATSINWGSNIIVSLTFLDILNAAGIGPTFIIYGFISYGAAIFIFICMPETKGKSLEEIDQLLSKGLMQKDVRICNFSPRRNDYAIEQTTFPMDTNPDNQMQQEKSYKYTENSRPSSTE